MNAPQEPQDFRQMTADTIGKDLLGALLAELKLLPDPWPKLSQRKQDDIIGRLRSRIESNVRMAVHMLAAQGRTVVAGDLDQITIKDGVKAVVKFGAGAPNLHELFEAAGMAVLVVVASPAEALAGIGDIKGEADQRAMDLGHEYHDNDGGGMDSAVDIINGEALALPPPNDAEPTQAQIEEAYEDGYQAAADGKPESACPVMHGALCIAWVKGWKSRNAEQQDEAA